MSLGQSRKIAYIVISIFVMSLASVMLILGAPSDEIKIDILGTISHKEEASKEHAYRKILNNTEDPIFAIGSDGKFVFLSAGLESSLGYEPGNLLGQPFFPVVNVKDLPTIMTGFTKSLESHEPLNAVGPYRLQSKDGKVIYVLISAVAEDGTIIGSLKDISESIEKFRGEEKDEENFDGSGSKIRDTETDGESESDRLLVDSVS